MAVPKWCPLNFSGSLAKTVLNSLSANIAILDECGVILETNQAWRNDATENKMEGSDDSIGVNYLALCDATTGKEAKYARDVAAGIRSVIKGGTKEFLYDYPCHGIFSALLMATVRSALRQRLALPGSIAQIIADVNRQLVVDFADSGQFVTLFYLAADPARQILEWVRAGHEPAIFYDPATNAFLELTGSGMALGVDEHCRYEENRMESFRRGGIIVMGTDGVWEARNEKGQMFGRTAIYDVIRDNSAAGAGDIMEAILSRIKNFRKTEQPEDDVTLVVVKKM